MAIAGLAAGIAAVTAATVIGTGAANADTCSGQASGSCSAATGTVAVGTSLTLSITNGAAFNVNAVPGTAVPGVPPTVVNISTNDSAGYTLASFMEDAIPTQLNSLTNSYDNAVPAFTSGSNNILDQDWTVSVGGGTAQTYPAAPTGGTQSRPVQPTLTLATKASASAASGDNYSNQLALTVPGAQAPGSYTGGVAFLATGR